MHPPQMQSLPQTKINHSKSIIKVSKANTPTSTPNPTHVEIKPFTGRHELNPSGVIDNGFSTKLEERVE
jgi:hypothetical protein